ncbi:MAG: polysaccharide biosynthesis/export family protein [Bacteroidales bacterium]|nr:polysaccharide biosynthesis/export family protein [Bacteroidales bacterium]
MHLFTRDGLWALVKIAFVILVMASCVPMKKQIYMQQADAEAKDTYIVDNTPQYTLQPGNNLYLRVFSIDEEQAQFFNLSASTGGNVYYDAAVYLNSYSVNEEGYVELPFIGELFVKGMSLEEAKDIIQEKVNEYLINTMIIVKLVNYNVTVVGEVNSPAQIKIYQDRINIYEILGMAGDMTTYAKRDEVLLIRKTENGSKVHKLNLLSDEILESEFFYIMPDDIVYVQPVKGKNFAMQQFPYTLVISSISLIIAIFALVQ